MIIVCVEDHASKSAYLSDGPSSLPSFSNFKNQPKMYRHSNVSDDEPLYDAVADDDDYAALGPAAQQVIIPRIQNFKMNSVG